MAISAPTPCWSTAHSTAERRGRPTPPSLLPMIRGRCLMTRIPSPPITRMLISLTPPGIGLGTSRCRRAPVQKPNPFRRAQYMRKPVRVTGWPPRANAESSSYSSGAAIFRPQASRLSSRVPPIFHARPMVVLPGRQRRKSSTRGRTRKPSTISSWCSRMRTCTISFRTSSLAGRSGLAS